VGQRVTGGVVAGAIALLGNLVLLAALQTIVVAFNEFDDPYAPARDTTYDNDVWVILVVSLVLAVGWAWCAWRSEGVGFRVLIIANAASVLPLATLALAVERPSVWAAVAGVLGAAALGLLLARGMREPAVGAGR
jgi:hypothetical protein